MTGLAGKAAIAGGGVIARNPSVAGGFTAFLVVLAYVSANALWYQSQSRGDVIFETRPAHVFHAIEHKPVMVHAHEANAGGHSAASVNASVPKSDPIVARIQSELHDLGLYDGPIDGIDGPKTRSAIEAYKKAHPADGVATSPPAAQKPAASAAQPAAVAVPRPRPAPPANVDETATTGDIPHPDPALSAADIVRIQAGLKAFGNNGINIDGVAGSHTRKAIREFQALFHMPVTGQPDKALLDKMHEIGLIN